MKPNSPYAASKFHNYQLAQIYREAYNMKISVAISFNHESPRRGKDFVTRKVTSYVAQVKLKLPRGDHPLFLVLFHLYRETCSHLETGDTQEIT